MHVQGGDLTADRRQVFLNWLEKKILLEEKQKQAFYFFEDGIWWAMLGKNKRLLTRVGKISPEIFARIKEKFISQV